MMILINIKEHPPTVPAIVLTHDSRDKNSNQNCRSMSMDFWELGYSASVLNQIESSESLVPGSADRRIMHAQCIATSNKQ